MTVRRPPLFVAVLLALVCKDAAALSSPSPLSGYHFGVAASSAKKVKTSDIRRRGPKSYVPDGLTEEQYRQIKNEELAQQRKMKFGMWGPRFSQVDGDPDNNWFNVPSLWTAGFGAEKKKSMPRVAISDEDTVERTGVGNLIVMYLRRYGPAYLMLLLSAQILVRSIAAKRVLPSKWLAVRVVLPLIALKPMDMIAAYAGQKLRMAKWLERDGTTKLACVLAALVTAATYVLR